VTNAPIRPEEAARGEGEAGDDDRSGQQPQRNEMGPKERGHVRKRGRGVQSLSRLVPCLYYLSVRHTRAPKFRPYPLRRFLNGVLLGVRENFGKFFMEAKGMGIVELVKEKSEKVVREGHKSGCASNEPGWYCDCGGVKHGD